MAEKTKTQVDKEVRSAGEVLIDFSELTQVAGNIWIGKTEIDGLERFFEIKITAKKIGYSQDDVDALLIERNAVEERKAERATAAAKKKVSDEKRRADAAAKKAEKEKKEG